MIIADSNMSMSSRRHYSQKVSSGMVAAGSSGNSFSFGMSQARSSLSQKESYFSNSSDSSGRKYDDMFLMMPLYNRSGRLNVPDDSSKTDLAGEESPEGTEALTPAYNKASLVSMRQNVSFSYTEERFICPCWILFNLCLSVECFMILTVYPAIQSLTHLHLTKPQKPFLLLTRFLLLCGL